MEKEKKSRVIKRYIFIFFLMLAIIVSILLIVKYNVEGEKNLPFELDTIIVKSTLYGETPDSGKALESSVTQNNVFYFYFKKNKNVDKEIEKITINNVKIKRADNIGTTKLLAPTSNDLDTMFSNSHENQMEKGITYTISTIDNPEKREVCKDGGMVVFNISNQELGKYTLKENEVITYNSTSLLNKAGLSDDQIKITASMDITIHVDSKEKYKGTFTIDLPIENFGDDCTKTKEIKDFSNIIFKRSE